MSTPGPRSGAGGRPATPCPLSGTMALLAGAWTPFIIWYLRDRPRRFGDLKRDIGAISAKVLAGRLKELERLKVISRSVKPTSPPSVEYALTPLGKRLKPIVIAMASVGSELPRPRAGSRSLAARRNPAAD